MGSGAGGGVEAGVEDPGGWEDGAVVGTRY